ncbi:ArgS-related anticodon-binding protein NrtL [Streptomyces tropicalis]|uniref:arginine--tRNA ligase n=1 Tax=Streptomyces tropicalis TaxID=3034234 RepID=A0ABT6A084_9ACTN|nr:DALR anticodon-binding domain-containing protein [Streptomyces tropicalis]MDF3297862.1 DALR anticodon-binding domain-containing protein [Streptomyces tropicalis]
MTPVELSRTVLHAVRRAVDDGELHVTVPERALVTVPGPGGCGDYATNVALQLARPAGQPPLKVAGVLRTYLAEADGVDDVVVTGPGFLNISLRDSASPLLVEEILRRGLRYGHAEQHTGERHQLHCPAEVRAVVVTDVVARLLRSRGALVRSSCAGPPLPGWVSVLGVELDVWGRPGDPPAPLDVTVRPVPASGDPLALGRDAGRWALLHPAAHDRPHLADVPDAVRGAQDFAGDAASAVLPEAQAPAAPTSPHLVQRESNPLFRVRYAHARTRAMRRNAADLGFSARPGDLGPGSGPSVSPGGPALGPSVSPGGPGTGPSVSSDGQGSAPGTRTSGQGSAPGTGRIPSPDSAPGARTSGQGSAPGTRTPAPRAGPLLVLLADHPRVLAQAAAHRAPDRVARHLVEVADAVLGFLPVVLPSGEEKPSAAHRARLALAEAAGTVLAGGLSLLGIDAPEHL